MIARMLKVHIVARTRDRDRLLEALRDLRVVHVAPVDPARAVADEETVAAIDRLNRAVQILQAAPAAAPPLDLSPLAAADEVLRIQRDSLEQANRLSSLHRQVEQLALWGDVRIDDWESLRRAGVEPKFFAVPRKRIGEVRAECVQPIAPWPGKRMLVAVIERRGEAEAPEGSEAIPLPTRDRPRIRAEAARIDAALKADSERLARLAPLAPAMRRELANLHEKTTWTVAARSGLTEPSLYALQGWVPAETADGLAGGLAAAGLEAAVRTAEPAPEDDPPTLIRYPAWVRPIEGLFNILNIVPGYRELDVSPGFMIALPIFCAMLIGDGGYGLLFLILPAVFYRKLSASMGPQVAQLLMVIGFWTLAWGIMTASFFGVGPALLAEAGGIWESLGSLLGSLQLLSVDLAKTSRDRLMHLCFLIGAIHLSAAHLWQARRQWPDLRFLNNVGWAIFLWGTFGFVNHLIFKSPWGWETPVPYLLIVGGLLVALFQEPSRNVAKSFLIGLASSALPAISTFSDILSYVRLMAVGLAGSVLAISFNKLAASAGLLGIPVLLFGHALNIALCLIALFAHGVRLNVLEFSSNAGMEWSGYPYQPFARKGQEN